MQKSEFVFGKKIKERRIAKKLTQKELALKLGYKNIPRGIRRIDKAEAGWGENEIVKKIMVILGISAAERTACEVEEEKYLLAEIAKLPKFKPVLAWRAMACVYCHEKIPEELTTVEQMLEFASNFAKTRKRLAWLMLA